MRRNRPAPLQGATEGSRNGTVYEAVADPLRRHHLPANASVAFSLLRHHPPRHAAFHLHKNDDCVKYGQMPCVYGKMEFP